MLTAREKQVSRGLREGKGDKAIAAELAVSPATVSFHLRNLYRKTGVHSRLEFLAKGLRRRKGGGT